MDTTKLLKIIEKLLFYPTLYGVGNFSYITQLNKNSLQYSDALNYPITGPDGIEIWPGNGFEDKVWIWRWSKDKVKWGIDNGYIVFKKMGDKYKVYTKSYEYRDNNGQPINRDNPYSTLEFTAKEYANFNATPELERLFDGKKLFDFPKSSLFIKELVKMSNLQDGDIVLDIFSGSSTTADSVLQINAEDGKKRNFIMVQLPEKTDEDSEAFKAGYNDICALAEERIRRAGKKIKENSPLTTQDLDTGFRVYRIDSSNMKDVYFAPKDLKQQQLNLFTDNVKEDRTELDLLYGCMLDWGVELSLPLSTEKVDGCTVYTVNEGDLVACFEKPISEKVVKAIADKAPLRVLFRDSCFDKDEEKINIFEQFKQLLGWSDDEAMHNIRVI